MKEKHSVEEAAICRLTSKPGGSFDRLRLQGTYKATLRREGKVIWEEEGTNLVTDQGMHHMLDRCFDLGVTAAINPWYMSIATVVSAATDSSTGSQLNATTAVTEEIRYDNDTSRNTITFGSASGRAVTNSTAVSFVFDAGVSGETIRGAFVCGGGNAATQGDTATILWCVIQFATAPVVNENDQLDVTYTVTFGSSNLLGASI